MSYYTEHSEADLVNSESKEKYPGDQENSLINDVDKLNSKRLPEHDQG